MLFGHNAPAQRQPSRVRCIKTRNKKSAAFVRLFSLITERRAFKIYFAPSASSSSSSSFFFWTPKWYEKNPRVRVFFIPALTRQWRELCHSPPPLLLFLPPRVNVNKIKRLLTKHCLLFLPSLFDGSSIFFTQARERLMHQLVKITAGLILKITYYRHVEVKLNWIKFETTRDPMERGKLPR